MNEGEFRAVLDGDVWQLGLYDEFVKDNRSRFTVWSNWGKPGHGPWGSTYSCLLTPGRSERALKDPGWDLRFEEGRPGFSVSYSDDGQDVTYERIGAHEVEALLHVRFAVDRFPKSFIVPDELVLLFDLHEGQGGRWFWLDEAGDEREVIAIGNDRAEYDVGLVRRYQAVRQLALELNIDSDLWDERLSDLGEVRAELGGDNVRFAYYRGPTLGGREWISRLIGKRILSPPPIDQSGLWPFEHPDQYESFAIGADDMGRPIEYSADPSKLADYFGKNKDAPPYVTPVMFRRAVLEKYYNSDKYQVEDGYLRRGAFWGIRIDNDSDEFVTVMLGDLGRDLPYSEQKYWKSFNLAIKGTFSKTAIKRGFLAQFADPSSPDLQFRRLYQETNATWLDRFGWSLYLEPSPEDAHILDKLRVLAEDQQLAFDDQALRLAKLMVDALNEKALIGAIGPGPDDERGIAKLERFLTASAEPSTDSIIDTLQRIQAVRSASAAHRKGKRFEQLRAAAPSQDRRLWFADLLERAITALEDLQRLATR